MARRDASMSHAGRKENIGSKLLRSDDGAKDLARSQQTLIDAIKHFFI